MKRLGIVAFPGFQILDMAAASVFEIAKCAGPPERRYDLAVYSEHGDEWRRLPA